MFGLFGKKDSTENKAQETAEPNARRSRICEIGWLVDVNKAAFIYGAPRQLTRKAMEAQAANRAPGDPGHPKSVAVCPAVIDNESRHLRDSLSSRHQYLLKARRQRPVADRQ